MLRNLTSRLGFLVTMTITGDRFEGFPDEVIQETPEVSDNYIGANVKLPVVMVCPKMMWPNVPVALMERSLAEPTSAPLLTRGNTLLNLKIELRLNWHQMPLPALCMPNVIQMEIRMSCFIVLLTTVGGPVLFILLTRNNKRLIIEYLGVATSMCDNDVSNGRTLWPLVINCPTWRNLTLLMLRSVPRPSILKLVLVVIVGYHVYSRSARKLYPLPRRGMIAASKGMRIVEALSSIIPRKPVILIRIMIIHTGMTQLQLKVKMFASPFSILDNGEIVPWCHTWVRCHMIFDIKMKTFWRKVRLVAGGNITKVPAPMTYTSADSRESVYIALAITTLNGLQAKAWDLLNGCMTVPITEKIWAILGQKFGFDAGKTVITVWVLYGLKSRGAAFCVHLCKCRHDLGWVTYLVNPDLWYKPVKQPNGTYSYYYVIVYVNDMLLFFTVMTCLCTLILICKSLRPMKIDCMVWGWLRCKAIERSQIS